ncbi:MAG: ATP-binding protein [Eggerthellaceae bacterium]
MEPFDYTHVHAVARIALYDDLRSAPRVTEIHPAPTAEFIESLASKIYEQAKNAGGTIPYTVIREVSENFIHARFAEATVSILDEGNTIRFADQGPGIPYKDPAQIPGFTSAVEPMKHYIRGVGSGLPIVKEYLDFSHGTITIEDNLGTGAVVTISLRAGEATDMPPVDQSSALHPASAQPSAMEPAYPMHEAPQQRSSRDSSPAADSNPAPAQYGYANPPYPREPRPHDLRLRSEPQYAPALCAESWRQARPTIHSTVPRLIALRA